MDGHDYNAFLQQKIKLAEATGFEVDPQEINPELKDFVRAIVCWAARGGRRGIFSAFGLHKTSAQLELARLAMRHRRVTPLIVVPLGVRQEFFDEAETRFTLDEAAVLRSYGSKTYQEFLPLFAGVPCASSRPRRRRRTATRS
jgi:hypothetical protein